MKIYSLPKEVPAPTPDYSNYNHEVEDAAEKAHMEKLAAWLKARGCTGKYTGSIFREQIADGYANYMVADGPKFFLVHLPYGDAYDSRNVEFLPKKEIIRRIEAEKKLHEMLEKRRISLPSGV